MLQRVEKHGLAPKDIAERLKVSVWTVYRWIESGELEHVDVGTSGHAAYRVTETALAAFLHGRRARRRRRRVQAKAIDG